MTACIGFLGSSAIREIQRILIEGFSIQIVPWPSSFCSPSTAVYFDSGNVWYLPKKVEILNCDKILLIRIRGVMDLWHHWDLVSSICKRPKRAYYDLSDMMSIMHVNVMQDD